VKIPAALLLCVVSGCPKPVTPPVTPNPPPPLDTPVPAGRARCGLVTRSSEQLGGPGAYLEPHKGWRCDNAKVRFGGATREGAVGLALRGGSLLDMDVVRPAGEAGQDQFREMFPAPGFMGVDVTGVEIVSSGEGGGDAVVRVRGRSAPLGVLPQILIIEKRYDGEVITDFILHPDVSHLEVTTTVINNGAAAVLLTLGDYLSMGSGVRAFTPETGFGEAALFSEVSVYAGTSARVSYAYTMRQGGFTIPVVDAGGTATLARSDVLLTAQESYTRFLAVGPGSLASVLAETARIRGEPLGALRVALTQGGSPVAGTLALFRAPYVAGARVVNHLRVDGSGVAAEDVAPGSYVAKAAMPGGGVVTSAEFAVVAGQQAALDLELPGPGNVVVTAHEVTADGTDRGPVPAKLSVVPLGAPPVDEDLESAPARGLTTYVVAADGRLEAPLPPGRYRLLVSRGPEYALWTQEVDVAAGATVNLDAPLVRVLSTSGLLAAEFHQHTLGSLDSETDLATKVVENAAEGVELAAATDHDNVKDYGPMVQQLALGPFFQGWAGNEISYNGVGHFNAYPLTVDPQDPFADVGARLWAGRSVADLFGALRARPEDPVIHISHPRANNGKGYFSSIKLNPVNGGVFNVNGDVTAQVPVGTLTTLAQDVDALEVNEELAPPDMLEPGNEADLLMRAESRPLTIPTMVDWFHLLSTGHHWAALGNSDSHGKNDGSGWPRNYLVVADDRPDAVTTEDVRVAIRSQKVLVSNGLLVRPMVDGVMHLGRQDVVAVAGNTVTMDVTLESATWLGGANVLNVFLNGRPQHLMLAQEQYVVDAGGTSQVALTPLCDAALCRQTVRVVLPVDGDGWVVFVARGAGRTEPVGRGSVYGYTNPVYLDANGDGWAP